MNAMQFLSINYKKTLNNQLEARYSQYKIRQYESHGFCGCVCISPSNSDFFPFLSLNPIWPDMQADFGTQ